MKATTPTSCHIFNVDYLKSFDSLFKFYSCRNCFSNY